MSVRLLVACVAGLVVLTGCGVQPSGVITGGAPPSGGVAPGIPPTEPDGTFTLYLVMEGGLFPVRRPGGPLSPVDALAVLAASPNEEERGRGLSNAVPPQAIPFSVTADPAGGIAVTLSAQVSTVAIGQIVCTVAAAATAKPSDVTVVGSEGRGPQRCP